MKRVCGDSWYVNYCNLLGICKIWLDEIEVGGVPRCVLLYQIFSTIQSYRLSTNDLGSGIVLRCTVWYEPV